LRSRLHSKGARLCPASHYTPIDREIIRASILESRLDLWRIQRDLHDTVLASHETILQITRINRKGRQHSSAKIGYLAAAPLLGSLAIFTAIRRASSLLSNLAAVGPLVLEI